jgi:hypothetical protein
LEQEKREQQQQQQQPQQQQSQQMAQQQKMLTPNQPQGAPITGPMMSAGGPRPQQMLGSVPGGIQQQPGMRPQMTSNQMHQPRQPMSNMSMAGGSIPPGASPISGPPGQQQMMGMRPYQARPVGMVTSGMMPGKPGHMQQVIGPGGQQSMQMVGGQGMVAMGGQQIMRPRMPGPNWGHTQVNTNILYLLGIEEIT